MRYYDITNSAIVSQNQILKANPNTSFSLPLTDSALAGLNIVRLTNDPRPDYDQETQDIVAGPVEVRDGIAYQTYSVIDRSADEIANDLANKKADIRAQRNNRLTETDWAMLPDSPLSDADKTIYQNYRSALRDFPAQAGFPNNPLPQGPDENPGDGSIYDDVNFAWIAP